MESKILSLNVSHPEKMEWNGQETISAMFKKPISGPLKVSRTNIEGDSFRGKEFHGTPDSVIYVFGMTSALAYMRLLGRESYTPGALGENITLESFDEQQVQVGDIFSFGEVIAQCTFPRIPCPKVNIRMQHAEGQKLFMKAGRSGAYFRILTPGLIHKTDVMKRVSQVEKTTISLPELYSIACTREKMDANQLERLLKIDLLPKFVLESYKKRHQEMLAL